MAQVAQRETVRSSSTRGRKPAKRLTTAQAHKDQYVFDEEAYTALGQEMAQAATSQVNTASTYWERCRSMYVEAQDHDRATDALVALFTPGEHVKGRKAPWYRTYKSLLSACEARNIHLTNEHGMSAVQALIKANKEEEIETDPIARAAKNQRSIDMFRRQAQGCLNLGIGYDTLLKVLKELTQ